MSNDKININISGGVADFGSIVQGSNNIVNQQTKIDSSNLKELKEQLELLRNAMKETSESLADDEEVLEVSKAIESANKGDEKGIITHLKKIGRKALIISEKIGISLVTAILKDHLKI